MIFPKILNDFERSDLFKRHDKSQINIYLLKLNRRPRLRLKPRGLSW